jgi:hypothetical protein
MRELRIPTRKTNPIHNDVPENTTFLLLDQPSGEEKTTGTLISKIDEVAINAKTANWKAIVMFLILQVTNKRTIPFDPSISQKNCKKKNASWRDCTTNPSILYDLLPLLSHFIRIWDRELFFTAQMVMLDPASIYILYTHILYTDT